MGRKATKATDNVWYQARIKASAYDDRLASREGAAELLGMSVSAVADAELGLSKVMPVDKAVLMADLYNAPQLLNHFCLHECPIGSRHAISENLSSIEHVTVNLLKGLQVDNLSELKKTLIEIAADGVVDQEELIDFNEVVEYLEEVSRTVSELKTICSIINKKNESDNERRTR